MHLHGAWVKLPKVLMITLSFSLSEILGDVYSRTLRSSTLASLMSIDISSRGSANFGASFSKAEKTRFTSLTAET